MVSRTSDNDEDSIEFKIRCKKCNAPWSKEDSICPSCGFGNKVVTVDIGTEKFKQDLKDRFGDIPFEQVQSKMRFHMETPGQKKQKSSVFTFREKKGKKSGKPAEETFSVNRLSPEVTIVEHKVKELIDEEWEEVHAHKEEYKKRKKNNTR